MPAKMRDVNADVAIAAAIANLSAKFRACLWKIFPSNAQAARHAKMYVTTRFACRSAETLPSTSRYSG